MSEGRLQSFQLMIVALTATTILILIGLFFGAARHRRLRSWLALTALVCAWAALWSNWPELAWAGARWRVGRHIDQFEKIAAPLRTNWPKDDSETPELGAFSAYPIGEPRALFLLTTPPSAKDGAAFNTIERTPDGGLAFQLVDNEFGTWLEWHPEGVKPASFIGGLETRYTLERSSALRNGWHLTQYDAKILE